MYKTFEVLQHQKAKLEQSVTLNNKVQLSVWHNSHDRVNYENSQHHTLSMYIEDGYESYHKRAEGWVNGGEPGRFCLLPKESTSSWDVRGNLRFIHLYCTDNHLIDLAEQTWDKSLSSLRLDESVFVPDQQLRHLMQHFLNEPDWDQPVSRMMLGSASTMVMLYLLQHYSQLNWKLPETKGGLAPHVLHRIEELIHANLADGLSLTTLAHEAQLSEYHFARMFKASVGLSPHQYVLHCRLKQAAALLSGTPLPVIDVAVSCGFTSVSHFSQQFKLKYGMPPSAYRAAQYSF